jgi:hypothetical protein
VRAKPVRVRLTQAKSITSKPIKLVTTPGIVNDLNRLTGTIAWLRFRAALLLEVSAKDPASVPMVNMQDAVPAASV